MLWWPLLVVVYVSLDIVNFKVLAPGLYNSFYADGIVNYEAAALIYILYPLSIVYLTRAPDKADVIVKGFILGVTGYGLYHLTSAATLRNWSVPVAAYDTLWGGMVTAFLAWLK